MADGSPAGGADVLFGRRKEWIRNVPREETAGADGSFCFASIDPGEYLLGAALGLEESGPQLRGYYPGNPEAAQAIPLEIKGGESGSGFNFVITEQRAFKISGRVILESKQPPPWEQINVFLVRADGDLLSMAWRDGLNVRLGEGGTFEFENVLAGSYKVTGWIFEEQEQAADEVITPAPPKWNVTQTDVEIRGDTKDLFVTITPVK